MSTHLLARPFQREFGRGIAPDGTPEQVAETMTAYRRIGFSTFIVELPAPFDLETMESLITTVKPMVESVPAA